MSGPPCFAAARRVVVTGIGMVTPLGVGTQHCWSRLVAGDCGVRALDQDWLRYTPAFEGLPARVAGLVPRAPDEPGFYNPTSWHSAKDVRRLPDGIQYGICAAAQAVADSGWAATTPAEQERAGVAIGCGMSGVEDLLAAHDTLATAGLRRVSPFTVPHTLVNMTAGLVSIKHGLKGPNHAVSTACATGAHAIGDAFRFVSLGDADVMVAGGTDACIAPAVVAGFSRMKALATNFNHDPEAASRPFDSDRSGFVIAEGAAVLVLEELEHALHRQAHIYAELRGYGLTGDAHHISAPAPDGDGAYRAMRNALRQAGLAAADLDYINAHATSTPLGDAIEARAIARLMADLPAGTPPVSVSSTKGATGHTLGAAGALEAAFTVLALANNTLPPTLNATAVPILPGVDIVCNERVDKPVAVALSNSFGFGGTNASLCFAQAPASA